MSYHVFFSMSTGITKAVRVPKGTLAAVIKQIKETETLLGLTTDQYKNNPKRWVIPDFNTLDDEVVCGGIERHNNFVMRFYDQLSHWASHPFKIGKGPLAKHVIDTAYPIGWGSEKITPKDARGFWHGLRTLEVPVTKWTREYYVNQMETLYEVMRGRTRDGISFDESPLTPKQAAQVINIFSTFLDDNDCRLDVPNGHDYLASSYDGGYDWCEKCGAMTSEDGQVCAKRGCPLRKEYRAFNRD